METWSDDYFRAATGNQPITVVMDGMRSRTEAQLHNSTQLLRQPRFQSALMICESFGEIVVLFQTVRWLLVERKAKCARTATSQQQHAWPATSPRQDPLPKPQRKGFNLVYIAATLGIFMIDTPLWRGGRARSAARRRIATRAAWTPLPKSPPLTLLSRPRCHSLCKAPRHPISPPCDPSESSSPTDDEYIRRLQNLRHAHQHRLQLLQLQQQLQLKQKAKAHSVESKSSSPRRKQSQRQDQRQALQRHMQHHETKSRRSGSSSRTASNLLRKMNGNSL